MTQPGLESSVAIWMTCRAARQASGGAWPSLSRALSQIAGYPDLTTSEGHHYKNLVVGGGMLLSRCSCSLVQQLLVCDIPCVVCKDAGASLSQCWMITRFACVPSQGCHSRLAVSTRLVTTLDSKGM